MLNPSECRKKYAVYWKVAVTKKILIADDEEDIIDFLKTSLEMNGYSVVSTSRGSKVSQLIKENRPDLLITDVHMPGMDGYSLMLELSQKQETAGMPVIVMTGLAATRLLFEKIKQVKHFITKPFEAEKMLQVVKELIG